MHRLHALSRVTARSPTLRPRPFLGNAGIAPALLTTHRNFFWGASSEDGGRGDSDGKGGKDGKKPASEKKSLTGEENKAVGENKTVGEKKAENEKKVVGEKKADDENKAKVAQTGPKKAYLGRSSGVGGGGAGTIGGATSESTGDDTGSKGFVPSRITGFGEEAPKYPHLIGLPVATRPLFPGVLSSVTLTDPATIEAFERLSGDGAGYVGVFLRKDAADRSGLAIDTPELITDPEQIYGVGTLAQVHRIHQGAAFTGSGASGLHAHPTKQEWEGLSSSSEGSGNGVGQEEGLEGAEDGGVPSAPASVLLYTHRRVDLLSVDNFGPPIDVTVSHWDRLRYDPAAESNGDTKVDDTIRALTNEVLSAVRDVAQMNPLFREHMQFFTNRIDPTDPYRLADFVSTVVSGKPDELQAVLEERDAEERLHKALILISKEREVSKLQQEISAKVEEKMSDTQRKYFLNEQLKSIKKELGMEKDDKEALLAKYREKLEGCAEIPDEAKELIDSEMEKMSTLEKNSTEFNVTRNYLDWLTAIPWGNMSEEIFDIADARRVLNRDHYGMDDVKDIILQFIAVGKLKGTVQGKILCLAGPPGVGKTSIASSVAEALGRKFYRFSVGGLSDVSEIKGHRRTYVGAMPGKMVQCLKTTASMNPLILIDEIDKLGQDFRGDPASALLEVLDPNQNGSFRDHFLDVPLDMSKVLFMCTANDLGRIPGPLLDRMEVVTLSGYDVPEKIAIADQYLVPKSMTESGLMTKVGKDEGQKQEQEGEESTVESSSRGDDEAKAATEEELNYEIAEGVPESLAIEDSALENLVRWYCREAGVRNLEKHINKITRKLALQIVAEKEGTELNGKTKRNSDTWIVSEKNLDDYVGKPIFTSDRMYETDPLPHGVVMGLAWTSMGGSALYIETQAIKRGKDAEGKQRGGGTLQTTGQLGDVMSESTKIAYTVSRARLAQTQPDNTYFDDCDLHMHVPEGATPKDGPSAGVTMVTAMLSLALNRPVGNDLAMTGEVSLTGKVLPVGGIREKTMAARRAGIKCIVFPAENKKDFDELPDYLKEGIEAHFASEYSDVYDVAFAEN